MTVKYVALDLHQASTSISIRDVRGRVVRREVVPTSAAHILEVIDSAGGTIHVTLEEGTLSQWIYDQVVSHVTRVIVCDPRHNRLLAAGNKSASELLPATISVIDKAVQKGVLHKNAAARHKSRLTARMNQASAK